MKISFKWIIPFIFLLSVAGGIGKAWDTSNFLSIFLITTGVHFALYLSMASSFWAGQKIYERLIYKGQNENISLFTAAACMILLFLIFLALLHLIPGFGEEISAFFSRASQY